MFFALCVCVFFFFLLLLLLLFSFFPLFFLFFFLLIAWSKFALIFHIARFQFQKYKIFSFWGHIPLRHPLCVQACNWRWRSTKSSPNVEDGCTALCCFGVLAVVKCCKQCFYCNGFFFLLLFLYINSRLFYLSLWRMKINLFTKFWGKLLTNKRNVFTWWSLFTL